MGTKCAPPCACFVVGCNEKTEVFLIELPKFFSTEEIEIMRKVFRRYMDDGLTLWQTMSSFDSFMVCLNNLHPSINYTSEKNKSSKR